MGGCPTGQARVTPGFDLPARYVIHTVGPIWRQQRDPGVLRACYSNSLAVADRLNARTVAFPLISSGVYGWPVGDAIHQAITAIRTTRTRRVKHVTLVIHDRTTYLLAKAILAGRPS
jgi:O-acetyl-ADP-ribose deacetylase (regulator of RNase III)